MTMTDPVADMLTRIRNANVAHHDTVDVPCSKMKKSIAEILLAEGYIKNFEIIENGPQATIHIEMKYGAGKENSKERVICFPKRDHNSEFDVKPFEMSDLKEHRNYTFALSNVEGQGENWSLHIIDKRTLWEVARL